ncbi:MAG: S1 RNA-binding domain-containing protein, partial [Desulfohalobiaceae bacterium]
MVSRGEEVSVKILSIDQEGSKLSLSLREAEGDPWAGAAEKYPRGRVVTGTVERVEGFGVFVGLEPGITGLLPKSLLDRSPERGTLTNLKPGDQVAVLVQDIRPQERKMTLGPTDLTDTEDWGGFAQQDSGSFGSLGESLDAALKARKKG